MKIGLFFGSFNPIHTGHLIIANHFAQGLDLQQVWFIVSPQNPLKKSEDLLGQDHRLNMVKLAIENNDYLRSSDIEFNLSTPSFTIDTLRELEKQFPDNEWALIMGADTVHTLPKWKEYKNIVDNFEMMVYPRPFYSISKALLYPKMMLINDVPLIEISATYIRTAIRAGKNCRYLLPEKVYIYIMENGLYT